MTIDRFPPNPLQPGAAFAVHLRDIETRLRELERSQNRGLGFTTIRHGTLILDGGGLRILDGVEGYPVYEASAERGVVYPGLGVPLVPVTNPSYETITAGSFVGVFAREVDTALASALHVVVPWATDSGTTGELRLMNNVVGGNMSNAITLAANTSGNAEFKWLHGQAIGFGPFFPIVQARRTSGGGNVYIWPPYQADLIDGERIGANVGGTS